MRAFPVTVTGPVAVVLFSKRMAPRLPAVSVGPVPSMSKAFGKEAPERLSHA
jgi:hypothetical protein